MKIRLDIPVIFFTTAGNKLFLKKRKGLRQRLDSIVIRKYSISISKL